MKWDTLSSEDKDRLVATKVMDWHEAECDGSMGEQPCSPDGWFCQKCGHEGYWGDNFTHDELPPRYSRSMTTAWDIVIHVQKVYAFSQRHAFFAEIQRLVTQSTDLNGIGKLIAWPDVLFWLNPDIVCQAALKACDVEIERE